MLSTSMMELANGCLTLWQTHAKSGDTLAIIHTEPCHEFGGLEPGGGRELYSIAFVHPMHRKVPCLGINCKSRN